jgi:hypothetical protein
MNKNLPHLKLDFMKRMLSIVTIAATMMACNSNSRSEAEALQAYKDSVKYAQDTAGLAEFQTWKAQTELAEYNAFMNNQSAPVTTQSSSNARRYSGTSSRSNGNGNISSSSQNAAKKKGWSKAAKGAVIGTAGGAVIGAVVNKRNRVVGGVVGGVLGGGIGYGIGRKMDKKDGRY